MQAATMKEQPHADPEGLEKLFLDHNRRVFQAAYRITGNAADAEDVLQTVFLRLVRQGARPDPTSLPASYFHLAAVNGALDVVRGRATSRTTPIEDVEERLADAPGLRPDRRHGGTEMRERLRLALGRMNPKSAEVFALRYLEGYSNLEIARMLRKPQALIAVTLHRVRRRLRDEIRPIDGGNHEAR